MIHYTLTTQQKSQKNINLQLPIENFEKIDYCRHTSSYIHHRIRMMLSKILFASGLQCDFFGFL